MGNFSLFPNLATELRLKIWRSTLPGPRNVGVRIKFIGVRFGGWIARENSPPPPLALQVCHESRKEALKYYILSFGTADRQARVYFNYHTDTLCFGDGMSSSSMVPASAPASDYLLNLWHGKAYIPMNPKVIHARTVRFLSLDVDETIYSRTSFCWEEVRLFDGLEELRIITWDPEQRADELMAYYKTSLTTVAKANPKWVVPKTEVVSTSGRAWGGL